MFNAVQALMGIKNSLVDPHSALDSWDAESVDPCNWAMVTCSPDDHFVTALYVKLRTKKFVLRNINKIDD